MLLEKRAVVVDQSGVAMKKEVELLDGKTMLLVMGEVAVNG